VPLKSTIHLVVTWCRQSLMFRGNISLPSSLSKRKPARKLAEVGGKLSFVQVDLSSIISLHFILRGDRMETDALARRINIVSVCE
jgi:hypothetical protein